MADLDPHAPDPAAARAFARKVRLGTWALFFERLWPRLWVLVGVVAAFAGVSFAGVWPSLPTIAHQVLLAAYGLAAVAALIYAVRAPWPSREEAIRRIERRSGAPHRPASSYEDTLSVPSAHADTNALWQAHRDRLGRAIQKLKVGTPSPRADRFDPFAIRVLALLLLIPAALLATGSLTDRFASAFRFDSGLTGAETRLDAWVTPPPYTALPPVLLADGGQAQPADAGKGKLIEAPERSLLTLRGAGFGSAGLSIEVLNEGAAAPEMIAPAPTKKDDKAAIAEVRYELKRSAIVRALAGSRELGQWTFGIIPDQAPKIALSKPLDRTPRGSLKIDYAAEDDYGVASAAAKVRQIAPKPGDPSRAWAKAPELTGLRLPLERPPVLDLKLPRSGAKTVEASTLLELGAHPWAGQRVELWLEATDVGGNIGRSEPVEMVLPARRFKKPLARALIEQRRKLAEDSRNRAYVARALNALAIEPQGYIESSSVYLNLRAIYYRLGSSGSRAAVKESIDQLWNLALLVEDGALSDAERALKDAQDKLSEALQKGADDSELEKLMAELKQKLNDYLDEMQKQAAEDQQQGDQQEQGQDLAQQDVDQMMSELEKAAREGSREDAEKMLSELRELMDRLQAGNSPEQKAEQQRAKDMMKKLNQLGDIAGKQQKLMDETYNEQNKPGQDGDPMQSDKNSGDQTGQNQRQGKSGQQGQQRGKQSDNGPTSGQELGGEKQAEGQQGQGPSGKNGENPGKMGLKQRQAQLRQQLEQLKKELEDMGVGDAEKLGQAEDAMGKAEDALEQGDMEEAAQQQAEALENMREGAQAMSEQMQKNAQQRAGRGGDQPKDPLGRPQRSQGPDLGTSVKVPGAIDAQRAREILDELRKRSGESLRPPVELDYIDRLLRRF
ncbi:MAG: TIGR02302 family protein [Hyphomicrobium sp.]